MKDLALIITHKRLCPMKIQFSKPFPLKPNRSQGLARSFTSWYHQFINKHVTRKGLRLVQQILSARSLTHIKSKPESHLLIVCWGKLCDSHATSTLCFTLSHLRFYSKEPLNIASQAFSPAPSIQKQGSRLSQGLKSSCLSAFKRRHQLSNAAIHDLFSILQLELQLLLFLSRLPSKTSLPSCSWGCSCSFLWEDEPGFSHSIIVSIWY